jgi:hypothetical protein
MPTSFVLDSTQYPLWKAKMTKPSEMSTGVKVAWVSVVGTILTAVIAGVFGLLKTEGSRAPIAIRGRVLDFQTELPVHSAKIVCDSAKMLRVTYSDSEGFFDLQLESAIQDIHIAVDAPDYEPYDRRISLQRGGNIEEVRLKSIRPHDEAQGSSKTNPSGASFRHPDGTGTKPKSEHQSKPTSFNIPDWLIRHSVWVWGIEPLLLVERSGHLIRKNESCTMTTAYLVVSRWGLRAIRGLNAGINIG